MCESARVCVLVNLLTCLLLGILKVAYLRTFSYSFWTFDAYKKKKCGSGMQLSPD